MSAAPGFPEFRQIIAGWPAPDPAHAAAVAAVLAEIEQPSGGLGHLADWAGWLAHWQGKDKPQVRRIRLALFLASHGGAGEADQALLASRLAALQGGEDPVHRICATQDVELRAYEMALDRPTAEANPRMTEAEAAHAMSYGMMAVEDGVDLLCLGCLGAGSGPAVASLAAPEGPRGLEALATHGGFEMAALAGAIIAARVARVPVVLDDLASLAAAVCLLGEDPSALDGCLIPAITAEPALPALLASLGRQPRVTLGGEAWAGAAAVTAVPLLRAAASLAHPVPGRA